MHAIAEIVIPPTDDVKKSIDEIMEYFAKDGGGTAEWWDFYVIGGRFSGHKVETGLDLERLEQFYAALKERKVTVSGLQCGKQELAPASQIPMVDELWREMFPGAGDQCILFNHAADQYGRHGLYSRDICTVAQVPDRLDCVRLIVAGPHWENKEAVQPKRMLVAEIWNGVEYQKTEFDGTVKPALASIRNAEGYRKCEIGDDWLVVTVDYHN